MRFQIILFTLLSGVIALMGCSGGNEHTIEGSGTIEGTDVNIGAEVSGKVDQVRVDEGARVNKGDTLVVVDDADYRLQLQQARANQQAAEAQYKLVVEGARREDILQAEAAYDAAKEDFNRMQNLLESKTVTQRQYDEAKARFVAAEQTYEKLRRGARNQEIVAARARRDQAAAAAQLLQKKVNDCSILAPSRGIVTLRAVEPGELLMMGANVLRITYLEKVDLTIYVGEQNLGKVSLGQSAKVTIDAYQDRVFEGKVVYISPVAEFTPKNVQTKEERTKLVFGVKIEVENPDGALKPGLPADAVLDIQ